MAEILRGITLLIRYSIRRLLEARCRQGLKSWLIAGSDSRGEISETADRILRPAS